ncbi:MAG: hypothetical protein B9S32_06535 [Verrucomicrobia bacterium Tous-C9LFEB]|nr:MAG: hypothetical protein B9S32_06535 [Verrucomicrobia bacterium Tous-C9LFEB]
MMIARIRILLVAILLGGPAAIPFSAKAGETQGPLMGRIVDSVSQRLDYGLEVMVESEQWFQDTKPTFLHYEIMPQLIWHYSPRYDFAIGYERDETYGVDEMGNDTIDRANQGWASMTVKIPLKDWYFSSRQQFQGGIGDSEGEIYTFRHLVRAEYRKPFLPLKITPFVSNEYFLNLREGDIAENRFTVGLLYPFNKAVSVELFGMRDDTWMPDGNSMVSPVVGMNVKVSF